MNMAEQKNLQRGELRFNEPMSRHTSWRAGGAADRAYVPADLADMCSFVASLPRHEPVCVVGLGSNLLVRDGGLRGTVIFTHGVLKHIRHEGNAIDAEAGVPCPKLARFAAMRELAGAEFMTGIPGTVGGALTMNAGCYGGETWGIVDSVTTLDRAGQMRQRTPVNYEIAYRHVRLKIENEGQGRGNVEYGQAAAAPHASRLTKNGSSRRVSSSRAAMARSRARPSKSCSNAASPHSRLTRPMPVRCSATRPMITPRA